jgi:hypothetical protein
MAIPNPRATFRFFLPFSGSRSLPFSLAVRAPFLKRPFPLSARLMVRCDLLPHCALMADSAGSPRGQARWGSSLVKSGIENMIDLLVGFMPALDRFACSSYAVTLAGTRIQD